MSEVTRGIGLERKIDPRLNKRGILARLKEILEEIAKNYCTRDNA
jgi:hypothetical protein